MANKRSKRKRRSPPGEEELVAKLKEYGFSGEAAHSIAKKIMALDRNCPQLLEAELQEIATRVTDYWWSRWTLDLERAKGKQLKARFRDFVYGVIVGIVANGLFAALVYSTAKFFHMAGPDEEEETARIEQRLHYVREKLCKGLSELEQKELARASLIIESASKTEFIKAVRENPCFVEFQQAALDAWCRHVRDAHLDKFAQNECASSIVYAAGRLLFETTREITALEGDTEQALTADADKPRR